MSLSARVASGAATSGDVLAAVLSTAAPRCTRRRARPRGIACALQVGAAARGVLGDLLAATPPQPQPGCAALREQLTRLDAAVLTAFPASSPERALAQMPDRMGLGLGRR